MYSKLSFKQALFVVGVIMLVILLIIPFNNESSEQTVSVSPIHLSIPKINTDAFIEQVGLTKEGDVDSPKNPSNAAWYNLGPRPGEIGSSVIVGHFGWKNNTPAIFDNLSKLEKGDKIYVEDASKVVTIFIVREIRMYKSGDKVSSVFNSSDGKAHLNLITCGGVYNKIEKSYSDRLVVFSDQEQPNTGP